MRIAAWMVVRNDAYYVDMAIRSLAGHVDGIVVVDTGSTDDTKEKLQQMHGLDILVLEKDFGGTGRFEDGYREAEARNYAMKQTIQAFDPDWLVQIDADEVYNDRFWECVKDAYATGAQGFGHPTSMPVTPDLVSSHPLDMQIWDGKWKLFDPHVRSWDARLQVTWVKPEGGHVIPVGACHNYVTSDDVHFHLHRSFGPKSLHAWFTNFEKGWEDAAENLGVSPERINDQEWFEEKYPERFISGKFVPPAEVLLSRMKYVKETSHLLPEFVVSKWKEWQAE